MRKTAVAAAAVAGLLLVPGIASARTYQTRVGDPPTAPTSAPAGTSLNKFFPSSLRIRRGDRVRYSNGGFHTVSIMGRGETPPPFAIPDPEGGTYTGINKPDGTPFGFNGRTKFIYNPAALLPVGDLNINDTETHSTGVFLGNPGPPPAPGLKTLRFRRVGTYTVLCLIHPGMQQTVRVQRKRKGTTRPAAVRTRTTRQTAAAYRAATAASQNLPGQNQVFAGQERRNSSLLVFAPNSITVAAGTTVTFTMQSPSEVHDMVFTGQVDATGKGAAQDFADAFLAQTDLIPLFGPVNQLSPGHAYGSEDAVNGTYTYTGANAGNGFLFTSIMDDQAVSPLPNEEKVTFTTRGTYSYFCGIHGAAMSGTVTVQ